MDPITIQFAAALISAVLVKTGEKFAEKSGEALLTSGKSMYEALKRTLAGDPDGELILLRLHDEPSEEVRKHTISELLIKKADEDSEFAALLERLVGEARQLQNTNIFIAGNRNVTLTNSTTGSINTGDVVHYHPETTD
ncbi:MAG: hypothetical protein AB7V18_15635 [Pyrinomonadaceae bacterium]